MTKGFGPRSRVWRLVLLPIALALLVTISVSLKQASTVSALGPYAPAVSQLSWGWPYGYGGYSYGWPYGYSGYYNYGWPYGYNGYSNYGWPYGYNNNYYSYGYGYSPSYYNSYYGYGWPYSYASYWPYNYGYGSSPYSYVSVSVTPGTTSPIWVWCGAWYQFGKIPAGTFC